VSIRLAARLSRWAGGVPRAADPLRDQRGLEVQDDATAGAADREPAVCLGGVPGGHDVGDAQAEGAVLGQVPEFLKQRRVGDGGER
jgi:hypothetical protein